MHVHSAIGFVRRENKNLDSLFLHRIISAKIGTMHFSKIVFCIAASAVNAFLPPNSAFKSGSVTLFMGRQPIIAGNWKLNPSTLAEAEGLARGFSSLLDNDTCPISADDESCTEVVVFPPFPFLAPVNAILEDAGVPIGAQSVFFEDNGAFTGAVSASMLKVRTTSS